MASLRVNGDAVRAIRVLSGYSVVAFAALVGVKPAHISNIEANRRGVSPELLDAIARATGQPKAAFLAGMSQAVAS